MGKSIQPVEVETTRYRNLPRTLKIWFLACVTAGLGVAVFSIFNFSIRGECLRDIAYYYLLMAFFSSSVFLLMPARKQDWRPAWYDLLGAAVTFGIAMYFFANAREISQVGWQPPSLLNGTLAGILCLLGLEQARRGGGLPYFVVCAIVGTYPLYAGHMPGIFWGLQHDLPTTVGALAFGTSGLVGLPSRVMGNILMGFLLFAAILIASGAGTFFLNLAMGLLGRFRGGPAKVSVVGSALFGTLSGSAISNVVSTGCFTIPTMKRIGYPPHYAGAIEAVASTGGILMPPVMGAIAFVMATFLGVPYSDVVIVAIIPSLLYYLGLLVQVDAFAAKVGLKGLPREELPSVKKTLAEGWPFIAVLVFLTWGLLYMRWEAKAPFYASGLSFLLSFTRRETWMTPSRIIRSLSQIGKLITQTMALIIPIGFVIFGMTDTGFCNAFTSQLITLGGGNVFLMLLLGAAVCYLLGMVGLLTPGYIFLAISLAPAVVKAGGLDLVAVHLFILYYAMMACFTPPVAAAAFVGAAIAGANPMRTAFQATRLGAVTYFVPFFFVFNPALILRGPLLEAFYLFVLCALGVVLIGGGLEGYLLKLGKLEMWMRPVMVTAGFLVAFPQWTAKALGAALSLLLLGAILLTRRAKSRVLKVSLSQNK